jgi:hypothetical protein
MKHLLEVLCAAALICGAQQALAATQPSIISPAQARRDVMVKDVRWHDGMVSGVVVNSSGVPIRDVQLLIDEAFLWKDEWHPGTSNPSRATYYTVHGTIAPGSSLVFSYRGQPLPHRADGRFDVKVKVDQFTELGTRRYT